MRKSFQRVWNSFWALFHKWVIAVEMKNVLIWLVLKRESREEMILMMNDLNQPKASLKFNDMFHYYLFVEIFVYFDQYKIIKKKVNLNIN